MFRVAANKKLKINSKNRKKQQQQKTTEYLLCCEIVFGIFSQNGTLAILGLISRSRRKFTKSINILLTQLTLVRKNMIELL